MEEVGNHGGWPGKVTGALSQGPAHTQTTQRAAKLALGARLRTSLLPQFFAPVQFIGKASVLHSLKSTFL